MGEGKIAARKHDRVLEIYSRLLAGEIVNKKRLAEEYGVDPRSIQRDIDSIRDFCSNRAVESGGSIEIQYDHKEKGFRIVSNKTVTLTNAELFSVAKILLESRSLNKEEMEKIITDLLDACLPVSEKRKMADLVRNELFHYVEPRHGKALVDTVWKLGTAVYGHKKMEMVYQKANGEVTTMEAIKFGRRYMGRLGLRCGWGARAKIYSQSQFNKNPIRKGEKREKRIQLKSIIIHTKCFSYSAVEELYYIFMHLNLHEVTQEFGDCYMEKVCIH